MKKVIAISPKYKIAVEGANGDIGIQVIIQAIQNRSVEDIIAFGTVTADQFKLALEGRLQKSVVENNAHYSTIYKTLDQPKIEYGDFWINSSDIKTESPKLGAPDTQFKVHGTKIRYITVNKNVTKTEADEFLFRQAEGADLLISATGAKNRKTVANITELNPLRQKYSIKGIYLTSPVSDAVFSTNHSTLGESNWKKRWNLHTDRNAEPTGTHIKYDIRTTQKIPPDLFKSTMSSLCQNPNFSAYATIGDDISSTAASAGKPAIVNIHQSTIKSEEYADGWHFSLNSFFDNQYAFTATAMASVYAILLAFSHLKPQDQAACALSVLYNIASFHGTERLTNAVTSGVRNFASNSCTTSANTTLVLMVLIVFGSLAKTEQPSPGKSSNLEPKSIEKLNRSELFSLAKDGRDLLIMITNTTVHSATNSDLVQFAQDPKSQSQRVIDKASGSATGVPAALDDLFASLPQ